MNSVQQGDVTRHLVPKDETGASAFVAAAHGDGSGITLGILDTGVDPAWQAEGGGAKLVDVVDCTGSGDVDVSHETFAVWNDDLQCYQVKGLTGRTLSLSKDWNPSPFPAQKSESDAKEAVENSEDPVSPGKVPVRLGSKRVYELFPGKLKTRVAAVRKTQWDAAIAPHVAEVRAKLAAESNKSSRTASEKQATAEWQARLSLLQESQTIWEDPGPLLDCLVFFDGQEYKAVVVADNDESWDWKAYTPLARFGLSQQYGTMGVADQFNYAVQFYKQGRLLSIVSDASPHGTHVAGIAAGVAPKVNVVSFKIGDSRLGSMETGTSLARAMAAAQRYGCDVINLSYGEGTALANSGRLIEQAHRLVHQHNVVFVSSAGNNGPALSTVGAPGGTTAALLGIAAHVSPTMQRYLYSMPVQEASGTEEISKDDQSKSSQSKDSNTGTPMTTLAPNVYGNETHGGTTYTWSSVGPTPDGDWGVNLTAPGGAITTVPHWCLQKNQLMNGTSMSSPSASGCVALLLSAAKAQCIPTSPRCIARALQNTATVLQQLSICQQGAGMINVPAAWDYLKQKWQTALPDVAYQVTIDSLSGSPRGVYLRQPHETSVAHTLSVAVEPVWPIQDSPTTEAQQTKINFQRQFKLKSTCPAWVKVPSDFVLMSEGRSFKMDVDPRGLPPGLHTAQVLAVDTAIPDAGTIFQVPVIVTVPLPNPPNGKTTIDFGDLTFGPAEVQRFFVVPPLGTTWMDIVLTDTREDAEDAAAKLYALHTVQLLPHAAYRDFEEAKYYSMRPGQTNVASIPVQAGVTVEIVLGRYWSTLGCTGLHASLTYRGVRPVPDQVTLTCGDAGGLVRIVADIKDEKVAPSAKLSKWWTPLRPLENPLLEPLDDERDEYPSHPRRIYQLILTYEFTQEEKGSITPRVPLTQGVLYESALESQLIMVYDSNKKLLGTADAWPKSMSVPKGKITLRMQVRHDNPEKLEGLKEMPMWIERSLEKDIQLSVYSSREAMVLGKDSFRKRILRRGSMSSVFFQEPPTSKLPSGCQAGDLLKGNFTLCSGDSTLMGEGKRPKGFPFTYVVGPKPAKASDPETPEPVDERSVQEKLEEAIRDLKVSKLDSLTTKEKENGKFEEMFDEFVKDYPKHLPLLMSKLRYLDSSAQRMEKLNDIVDSANAVLAEISEDELALHFGKLVDKDSPDANKVDKQMKEKKTFLMEALARSAMAHLAINTEVSQKGFDKLMERMKAWVDIEAETRYVNIYFEREKRAGRYGSIIKTINKILSKDFKEKDFLYPLSKQNLMEERAAALEKLGYTPLLERDEKLRIVECPSKFAPF